MSVEILDSAGFEKEVLDSEIPVVVDFWATWCGPCKMLAPNIEKLSGEFEGRVKVCKVDVDSNMELARSFRVMSIPYVLIFKNGEVVKSHVGAASYPLLEALVNQVLEEA